MTPWTAASQAPLSMGFSRQEHWSRVPLPSPGALPTQESNPGLLHCRRIFLLTELQGKPLLHFFSFHLEKAMAPHSSTLAWKIPWTEEPGRLQSMGSLRVGHD